MGQIVIEPRTPSPILPLSNAWLQPPAARNVRIELGDRKSGAPTVG